MKKRSEVPHGYCIDCNKFLPIRVSGETYSHTCKDDKYVWSNKVKK